MLENARPDFPIRGDERDADHRHQTARHGHGNESANADFPLRRHGGAGSNDGDREDREQNIYYCVEHGVCDVEGKLGVVPACAGDLEVGRRRHVNGAASEERSQGKTGAVEGVYGRDQDDEQAMATVLHDAVEEGGEGEFEEDLVDNINAEEAEFELYKPIL